MPPVASPSSGDGDPTDSPSSGDGDPTDSTATATASAPFESAEQVRPRTRLQSGIRKPKVYIDATVKYSCFTSTAYWRTYNDIEALKDKN